MPHQILVVDDDTYIRDILAYSIRRFGFEVHEAQNAEDALRIIQDTSHAPIEVVLTDVWMPGMSGIDLLKNLRSLRPELPVAMISGAATLQSSIDALNIGAYAYLLKPFQQDQIKDVVQRGLKKAEESNRRLTMERELKERYQRLEEMQDHLTHLQESQQAAPQSSSNDAMTELVLGLRHELGNVTTAIQLNLEMIEQRPDVPGDLKENIQDLQFSADELMTLVSRLTEYPNLEKNAELIDLKEMIDSIIESAKRSRNHKQINYEISIQPTHINIYCNPHQLQGSLQNVLDNAVEAVPNDDGIIQVCAELNAARDRVVLTVSDNGAGFGDLNLEEVFSPSFTTKIQEGFVKGLGLGLFIARTTIEFHGGHIWLENRPTGGANVYIELPVASVEDAAAV